MAYQDGAAASFGNLSPIGSAAATKPRREPAESLPPNAGPVETGDLQPVEDTVEVGERAW